MHRHSPFVPAEVIHVRPGDFLAFRTRRDRHGLSIVVQADRSVDSRHPIITMTIVDCSGSLETMTLFVDNYGHTWYLL